MAPACASSVDGAETSDFESAARLVYLFDGARSEATGKARQQWQAAKGCRCAVTYWRQSDKRPLGKAGLSRCRRRALVGAFCIPTETP